MSDLWILEIEVPSSCYDGFTENAAMSIRMMIDYAAVLPRLSHDLVIP